MRKKIIDELTDKPLSKQRKWQIRNRARFNAQRLARYHAKKEGDDGNS